MGDCSTSESLPPTDLGCVRIVEARERAEREVAGQVRECIEACRRVGTQAVLGLATGGSMTGLLAECVRLHTDEDLSFEGVRTFNLDEYLDLPPGHRSSFHAFMHEHLFGPVELDGARSLVPDGDLAQAEPAAYSAAWEAAIKASGGMDLQLLGLGENGHVAFNEPGSAVDSCARVVDLAQETRRAAADEFGGLDQVPSRAFTAGIATIRAARCLRLLAFGERKAAAVHAMLMGPVDEVVPASLIRDHPNLEVWLDRAAASQLDPAQLPDGAWVR
ncbi:MAG TPA: glucosamine-6-phosphate deaminase [Planctomycetes bacterium]|nr:glucosamine-6-phosphate deaminase [Planctomycetota bacterium]HIK59531.1 glucosamine-6-phosphate deaminase [Planctomycetota bacterium]